jgi:predicted TIM-barrel fold metal-dependent hydrolase
MLVNEDFIQATSYTRNLAPTPQRVAQTHGPQLLPGLVCVSADTHLSITEDIWYTNFPQHLKEKSPRVWTDSDGMLHMGIGLKSFYTPEAFPILKSIESRPSVFNLDIRMKDLEDEGVSGEIAFLQTAALFLSWPDFEVREWIWRIYNEYVATLQQKYRNRLYPVGVANFWDPAKAAASIRHIKDLGLKTCFLPTKPGKRIDGAQNFYASPEMEPLWCAAEEAGLPVSIHIGEGLSGQGPPGIVLEGMVQLGGGNGNFRKIFAEMVFGGLFDRHPKLRIVFAEGGLSWVPGTLQDAEMAIDSYRDLMSYVPKHRPSDYWYEHCAATFMNDAAGLKQIDIIGAECALWGNDYPHNEGTFGYSRNAMKTVIDLTPEADARKILGGNTIRLFKLA